MRWIVAIKELAGYSQKITLKLEASDNTMTLKDDTLSDLLEDNGDYTYLTIYDGVNREVVKAYKDAGEVLIQRGQNGTTASTFPPGACAKFEINSAWIEDFVCQLPAECKPNPLPNECGQCSGCCD